MYELKFCGQQNPTLSRTLGKPNALELTVSSRVERLEETTSGLFII